MRTREIVITLVLAFLVGALVGSSIVFFAYWDYISVGLPAPEVVVVTVEVPVVVERERVEVVEATRVIEVEKIVQAPTMEASPTPVPTATMVPCVNRARLISSTQSMIDAGSVKKGTYHQVFAEIENTGTCVWAGYHVVSIEDSDFMWFELPVMVPGQVERVLLDKFIVGEYGVFYRLVMETSDGVKFDFDGGWQGKLIHRMEPYWYDDDGYGVAQICSPAG